MVFGSKLLLELDGGADGLELSLESLGVFLGDAFLDLGGDALDQTLRLGEAETGDGADFLDDLDLLSTEAGHDNVKLGLLLDHGASSGTGGGSSDSGGGDTEGVLKSMDELGQLENGKALDPADSMEPPFCSRI